MNNDQDHLPWEFATMRDRLFGAVFVGVGMAFVAFSLVALSTSGAGQVEQNEAFNAWFPYTAGIGIVAWIILSIIAVLRK